jgi:hypothetical protein
VLSSVDERYVSFVVDPASLKINPPGTYKKYPYPIDFTSTPLHALAKALSLALFVMTGGNSNCISYDGDFGEVSSSSSSHTDYMSSYCKDSEYYGDLKASLFKTMTDFAADTGNDFVWHLNMAFGRGYSDKYEPWDAGKAKGLLKTAGAALKGAMLFEEIKKSKLGFDIKADEIAKDLKIMKDALPSSKTLVYGVLNQDSDQSKAGH